MENIADFLFESGLLARTPRSGWAFMGSGSQSVAEHAHRTALAGYVLAKMDGLADVSPVVLMCLFHDLPETRTSDMNHVTKLYNQTDQPQALADCTAGLPFGEEVAELVGRFESGEGHEAILVRDADVIELLLSLKEIQDTGNPRAAEWIDLALPRLQTDAGKQLGEAIISRDSQGWWWDLLKKHGKA